MSVYGGSVLNWTSVTGCVGIPNLQLKMINDPEREDAIGTIYNEAEPPSRLRLMIGTYKNQTICEVRTEYVQAQIRCSRAADNADLACFVERMRHDPSFAGSGNLMALDIGLNYTILQQIPWTFASSHPGEPSILEMWLKDPTTAFNTDEFLNIGNVEFWYKDISLGLFADRLAMVLNTHLRASLQMSYIVGSDGLALKNESQSWAQANGTWAEKISLRYQLNKVWFLLYLLSAIVRVICALANIVLRTIIHIPDFLDSVSTLTRDSNYIHVATPGSTLNGIDRSKLLRDKHIMVQDVQPENEVGRLALSDSLRSISVQQDRIYI
ncbi:hypothetical protein COCSADRAFT_161430 [Bipolaris sorokiniana ND90Pr]|uniref:Uncharacterized protein n=1 Tax=Cochliobolus sativus (strain ND90Pr / ATCC 201652) TaxID=665912 RepID=M2T0Y4_COCSN|nr:uncharacterized protein COCSADRAFT_161430 [Bipolaris sorokiniana ND90Pr]EMD62876.1 hypothetical protein COCSADRAFT_161430 [Bipolaris sorokiniana ND90Pr]